MSTVTTTDRARHVRVDDLDVWVDERGEGPAVLLIAGLSDPAEAWAFQLDGLADRFHLIAFDNPGAGRTALSDDLSVARMADVAAGVLREVGVDRAHVCGFSGGSAVAQELALRHPEVVRSLTLVSTWSRSDAYFDSMVKAWTWQAEHAPDEVAMLEAFFLWIYTARAHESGLVAAVIEEALAFPYPQAPEAFLAQLAAWARHDTHDRLPSITVPTLVVAGAEDICTPPRAGRAVAEQIPGARFQILEGEAHQPFQESPEAFNALVDAFWREVDGG
jgi:pimeloyl-ACP methyl ester carboxylesterase